MAKLILWFVYVMCIMIAHNYSELLYHVSLLWVFILLMQDELRFKIGGITTTDLFTLFCYIIFFFYFDAIVIKLFCIFAITYQLGYILKRI